MDDEAQAGAPGSGDRSSKLYITKCPVKTVDVETDDVETKRNLVLGRFYESKDGQREIELDSWRCFADAIMDGLLVKTPSIWRGERDADYETSLFPSLRRRALRLKIPPEQYPDFERDHIARFEHAARGRRGANPPDLDTDDCWALAQHFGMATPLLDWTESPFVAAYIAFRKPDNTSKGMRAVYAIERPRQRNVRGPDFHYWSPESHENPRLVSQRGWFTHTPGHESFGAFVADKCRKPGAVTLLKFNIPDDGRLDFLRFLDRMNVNALTLFPDLIGSAEYCNMMLELGDS